jgi:glycosyltransferase involved in cell wall biosynthesis
VLAGQCRRSNAGLYFEDYYEFREALSRLESDAALRDGLGDNGKIYYRDHYRWDVVEGKYNRMLSGLREEDRLKPPVIAKTGLLARLVGA